MNTNSNNKQFFIWWARKIKASANSIFRNLNFGPAALVALILITTLINTSVFAQAERERVEIYNVSVSAPSGSSVLNKAPIYYVQGHDLDITLDVSPNATVKAVKVRGENIPLEESIGVDPPDIYYSIIFQKKGRVTIRLHFQNDGRGQSDPIKIIVGIPFVFGSSSVYNPATASFDFKLVRVKTVTRSSGNVTVSLSNGELDNELLLAIWEKFGDDGKFVAEKPDEDGKIKKITLYSPFYNDGIIGINDDGIHFRWGFKISVPNACDPTITITGIFRIEPNRNVVWSAGPDVSADFDYYCVFHSVSEGQKENIKQFIIDEIQNQVTEAFARLQADPSIPEGFTVLINSIETRLNELRVTVALPGDAVTIEVPYHGLNSNAPVDKGFALRPGDDVRVMASGVTASGVGPEGIFNARANPPIGDPNLAPGDYGLSDEGDKLFNALFKAFRDPVPLPFPQENVGALIVRQSNYNGGFQPVGGTRYDSNNRFLGAFGSVSVPASSASGWLNFGMNDYPEASLPSRNDIGTYTVAIIWQ